MYFKKNATIKENGIHHHVKKVLFPQTIRMIEDIDFWAQKPIITENIQMTHDVRDV